MSYITTSKVVPRVARFVCCMMWALGVLHAGSESLPYHLICFEENEGYHAGVFNRTGEGMQWLQGAARIVREEGDEADQCLETVAGNPFASIHFYGERVSKNHQTYFEIWVRPSASPLAKSEEFMDLDGAVLGFFADTLGGPATFHAYHSLPEQAGYWVSTGVSAPIGPDEMTQEWVRIGICQNLATETWDLKIGGEVVLTEIRLTEIPRKDEIQLWLLGHETQANRFDDLLISPVEPDSLRLGEMKYLRQSRAANNGRPGILHRTSERKVSRKQSDEDCRKRSSGIPSGIAKTAPKKLKYELNIIEGGTQLGKAIDDNPNTPYSSILLYSVQYDVAGNPLPLKLRIQCDEKLAVGVDLAKIRWVVTRIAKKEDKEPLEVIAHGDFSTGFTQIAEIPSKWVNEGMQIEIGTNIKFRTPP